MVRATNINFSCVKDKYTTKCFIHHKKFLKYHEKNKEKLTGVGGRIKEYKVNTVKRLIMKMFIRLLDFITDDILEGVIFTTPSKSKIYLGKFPKHKSRRVKFIQDRKDYYSEHDWSKSILLNSVVISIGENIKYLRIPHYKYKKLVKLDYSQMQFTYKTIEDYWDKIFELFPILTQHKEHIRNYIRYKFNIIEEEIDKGYSFVVDNYLFYTYRSVKEQDRWECLHRKKIYKKLRLWRKTHSLED